TVPVMAIGKLLPLYCTNRIESGRPILRMVLPLCYIGSFKLKPLRGIEWVILASFEALSSSVQSFCSIGTILPSRPARAICRGAQRRSRMARLRAPASAARSVLDGCEHDGMIERVGGPIRQGPL